MRLRSLSLLTLLGLARMMYSAVRRQGKPYTQEQVNNLVHRGLGDESGARLIEQRGIDFAPAEDFLHCAII